MKTIGILGGMSWESTVIYYQHLNSAVNELLGNQHSAKILLWSFDFEEIVAYQSQENWDEAGRALIRAALNLEAAGADCILITAATMHMVSAEVERAVRIPLIHMADPTIDALGKNGHRRPFLMATRYTMEKDFFKNKLQEGTGIDLRLPGPEDRKTIHSVIYDELCQGIKSDHSKQMFLQMVSDAADNGADSLILGCTEVGMLIGHQDVELPVYDIAHLHSLAAVNFATDGGF